MMRYVGGALVWACVFAGPSLAATIEFDTNNSNPLAHGSFLPDGLFDFGNGLTGTITTTGGVGSAQIYDTGFIGGRDPDLEQPTLVGNSSVTYDGGNALIVAENNSSNPDDADDAVGGSIEFVFDSLVRFSGITLIDGEDNQRITVSGDSGDILSAVAQGDDEFLAYTFAPVVTRSIKVDFAGSGAFDRLKVEVVPLPAAAWMLLAGIGGLAAAGRRKKLQSRS